MLPNEEVRRGDEAEDAVCIVQWITSLIAPLEGYAKKSKGWNGGNDTTNPLHLIILSELAQSSLFCR